MLMYGSKNWVRNRFEKGKLKQKYVFQGMYLGINLQIMYTIPLYAMHYTYVLQKKEAKAKKQVA
jgi:hypothetical protein